MHNAHCKQPKMIKAMAYKEDTPPGRHAPKGMKQETIFQPNLLTKVQVLVIHLNFWKSAGTTIPLDLPLNSFKEFLSPEAAINRYHANLKPKKNWRPCQTPRK